MRLVIDSNVWISALILPKSYFRRTLDKCLHGHEIFISPFIINEIEQKFNHPKLLKYRSKPKMKADLERLLSLTQKTAPAPSSLTDTVRDSDDKPVLALALHVVADCLITGDQDLVVMHPFNGILILSLSDFDKRYL